jgi:hypothetical protein
MSHAGRCRPTSGTCSPSFTSPPSLNSPPRRPGAGGSKPGTGSGREAGCSARAVWPCGPARLSGIAPTSTSSPGRSVLGCEGAPAHSRLAGPGLPRARFREGRPSLDRSGAHARRACDLWGVVPGVPGASPAFALSGNYHVDLPLPAAPGRSHPILHGRGAATPAIVPPGRVICHSPRPTMMGGPGTVRAARRRAGPGPVGRQTAQQFDAVAAGEGVGGLRPRRAGVELLSVCEGRSR